MSLLACFQCFYECLSYLVHFRNNTYFYLHFPHVYGLEQEVIALVARAWIECSQPWLFVMVQGYIFICQVSFMYFPFLGMLSQSDPMSFNIVADCYDETKFLYFRFLL